MKNKQLTLVQLLENVSNREQAKHAAKVAYTSINLGFSLQKLEEEIDNKYGKGTFQEAIKEL